MGVRLGKEERGLNHLISKTKRPTLNQINSQSERHKQDWIPFIDFLFSLLQQIRDSSWRGNGISEELVRAAAVGTESVRHCQGSGMFPPSHSVRLPLVQAMQKR